MTMEMESLADQLASVSIEDAIERLMAKGIMERAINDAIKKVDEAVATLGVSKAALMVFWNVHLVDQITAYLPETNIYGFEDDNDDDEDGVCRRVKCSICGLSQFMTALNYLTADIYHCDEHNLTHCGRCFEESEAENKVCPFCSRSFCAECTTITCLDDNEHFICADHIGDLGMCRCCDRFDCEQDCGSVEMNECGQCGELVCSDCSGGCEECGEECCDDCALGCCVHCDCNFCDDCAQYESDIDEWVCHGCASDSEDEDSEEEEEEDSEEGSD
jgi:hypothetical protein